MMTARHHRDSVPQGPATRASGPDRPIFDLAFSIALIVVALLPRLFVALAWAREPVWDGHYYHFGAERIAEGFGYTEDVTRGGVTVAKPWTHYPVGYSGLLSIVYRVFGSGIQVAPLVNAVIGTLVVFSVHRFARYMLSENRARIAGALAALHPGLIAYSVLVMTEQAAALFLLLAGWAAVGLRRSHYGVLLSGVLIGIAALIRPASLLALPALLLVQPPSIWRNLIRTTLTGLVSLLVILPWSYRNCQVMDGCALISTNGGWNLAIGAITETGRFQTLRADDGCPVVTGQVQQDRCWAEVGARTIEQDPKRWASMAPLKLSQTYDHESFPIEYLHESTPELWPEPRRQAGRELLTAFHRILMVLAALSAVSLVTSTRKKLRTATQGALLLATIAYSSYSFADDAHPFFGLMVMLPLLVALPFPGRPLAGPAGRYLYVMLFFTNITHVAFFGDDRYHLVISPMLCILAAGALRHRSQKGATHKPPAFS